MSVCDKMLRVFLVVQLITGHLSASFSCLIYRGQCDSALACLGGMRGGSGGVSRLGRPWCDGGLALSAQSGTHR